MSITFSSGKGYLSHRRFNTKSCISFGQRNHEKVDNAGQGLGHGVRSNYDIFADRFAAYRRRFHVCGRGSLSGLGLPINEKTADFMPAVIFDSFRVNGYIYG